MMRVEMPEAASALLDSARKAGKEPVVLTRRGRPVAALVALSDDDWEDLAVATHAGFMELIERSRQRCPTGQGIPLEEIKLKYGIKTKPARSRRKAG